MQILASIKQMSVQLCLTKYGNKVLNKLQKTYPEIFSNAGGQNGPDKAGFQCNANQSQHQYKKKSSGGGGANRHHNQNQRGGQPQGY